MKVLVIGAGAAGLRAAHLLHGQGIDVAVVEARDRVGGRLHTIRTPNGYWDAGGEWIDSDHRRVLALMSELGIGLETTDTMGGWLKFGSERWSEDDPPASMREAEASFLDLAHRDKDDPTVVDRTLADSLNSVVASAEGKWYVTAKYRSDEGEDLDLVGWRCWLQAYRYYAQREGGEMSQYRVAGGAQVIADRLAEVLPRVDVGRQVLGIEQSPESVTIGFDDGSSETADLAIVTCPPPIVAKWNWIPALPTMAAWSKARMGCAVKVSLHYETKFWVADGFPGRLLADRPFQQLWDSSHGDANVLQFYVCGGEGRRLKEGTTVVDEWLEGAEEVLPGVRSRLREFRIHDWCSDPFSLGGFSTWGTEDDTEVKPYLAQPHMRVHFAGEHTATWCGFIEGALESAERVAQEVLCRS
ncbi:MAG: L-amino acid dehydrogenase [Fimbriimonadaceae bacterium]|nr:L-amino acid dehydrogenase [Fimbriimonadaceae bacterium]